MPWRVELMGGLLVQSAEQNTKATLYAMFVTSILAV